MGKIFSEKIKLSHYQVDRSNHLSIPMISRLAIATSVAQTTEADIGMERMHEIGFGWVILQYDIKIKKLPTYSDEIVVETEPLIQNEYFATRRFSFLDKDGQELIHIDSLWTMMDMHKRKIVKIIDEFSTKLEAKKVPKVDKLQSPEKFDDNKPFDSKEIQSTYLDIDSNQHVNNSIYFDWFISSIDFDFLKSHSLERMIVKFQREVSPESLISAETQIIDENQLLQRITINGEIKTTAQTWWKEV